MKLLGFTNGKQIVASIARHDFVSLGDKDDYIMADSGQPHENFGFCRYWGKKVWFEVPQTFAELYNDYREKLRKERKYGVWNCNEVKILTPEEVPNTKSFEWQAENAIWGTLGINGDQKISFVMLKDCSFEHLTKIKELVEKRGNDDLLKIVDFWLGQKCKE